MKICPFYLIRESKFNKLLRPVLIKVLYEFLRENINFNREFLRLCHKLIVCWIKINGGVLPIWLLSYKTAIYVNICNFKQNGLKKLKL